MSKEKVYHVYEVISMKKSEYITLRTDKSTKDALAQLAAEKKWTISFLVEEIVKEWLEEHTEETDKQ